MKYLNNKWLADKWYDFKYGIENLINDVMEVLPSIFLGVIIMVTFYVAFYFVFQTIRMIDGQHAFLMWMFYVVVNDAMLDKYPKCVQHEGVNKPFGQIIGVMLGPISTLRYLFWMAWTNDSRFRKWYRNNAVNKWQNFANKYRIRLT